MGRAPAAAALVELDEPVALRVEPATPAGGLPLPGPPCSATAGLPSGLPETSQ